MTEIDYAAFYKCSGLTTITLPESLETIGNHTFYQCTGLKYLYCKAPTPPKGGADMFHNTALGEGAIYVPEDSVETYKAADGWKNYVDVIQGWTF